MALGKDLLRSGKELRIDAMAPLGAMLCLMEPVLFDHEARPQEVSFDPYTVSAHIAGQPIQRNLARPHRDSKAPSWKSSPGCDLDSRSGIDAGEVANAHQHTYVLRSKPHRRVGALVDAIQEQQPPDCSSQCVNHGRRRADAIALTSRPSKRRLLNGVAVWIVRGDFASPAASSPSTQLTRRFARRRRRSPSPSKSSTP